MRYLIVFLIAIHGFHSHAMTDTLITMGDPLYVFSFSGLNLRSDASTDAHIVAKLTHGSEVYVQAISIMEQEIDNRTSQWMKVKANGYEGFLFGGFLSSHEPPHLDNYDYDCNYPGYGEQWIQDRVKTNDVILENYTVVNPDEIAEPCREVKRTTFESGEEICEVMRDEYKSVSYFSQLLTFNDVLNFMDYYAACRQKFCGSEENFKPSLVIPVRNKDGSIKRLKCNYPQMMTAEKMGDQMMLQLSHSS